jgi:hypothetical protein
MKLLVTSGGVRHASNPWAEAMPLLADTVEQQSGCRIGLASAVVMASTDTLRTT